MQGTNCPKVEQNGYQPGKSLGKYFGRWVRVANLLMGSLHTLERWKTIEKKGLPKPIDSPLD